MLYPMLLTLHIVICGLLILLVLLQHGKGAEMGAAFGSGASATLFGARGSGNFLTRVTAILATLFFISNLALGYVIFKEVRPEPIALPPVAGDTTVPTTTQKNTPAPGALIPRDAPKKQSKKAGFPAEELPPLPPKGSSVPR